MKRTNEKASGHLSVIVIIFLIIAIGAGLLFISGCTGEELKKFNLGYKVYIPNLSGKSITVIPEKESDEPFFIDMSVNPVFIKHLPGSDYIYILLDGTNDIAILDTKEDVITDKFRFEVGVTSSTNNRIKFNSDGTRGYVTTSYQASGVAVLDTSDNSFVDGINVNSTTVDRMFFSSSENRLFATDPDKKKIYSLDTNSNELVEEIDVPESYSIAYFDKNNSQFFMAETGPKATVKLFDMTDNTFVKRAENVVDDVKRLMPSSDGTKLYVLGSSEMAIITLSDFTVDEVISLDYRDPVDFRFLPDKSFILIPSGAANLTMIMNPGDYSTEETIETESDPGEMVIISD
ncbi:MAG: hypothetical protein K8T10_17480 [Candidatus Eremiobacteraeota bacterium]|nr:hypothetical protein [Candidatus Eremiobacteraeota bacterium]